MKVLLVNGSPNEKGCTYTALNEVAKTLKEEGIGADFFHIGKAPISGCIGCYKCVEEKKCVLGGIVNEFTKLAYDYDGFVFGSPVYYGGMAGGLRSFMDRAFFSVNYRDPHPFYFKPAAAVVSARRGGTTSAFDQINKYFTIKQMPVVSSNYWNMVHGMTPEEVMQDEEGLQIMRILGRNMAWFLKLKEAGEKAGIPLPKAEEKIHTNFIH